MMKCEKNMSWREEEDKIKDVLKNSTQTETIKKISKCFETSGVLFFSQHIELLVTLIDDLSKCEDGDSWIKLIKEKHHALKFISDSCTKGYCCGTKLVHICTEDVLNCKCFEKTFDTCRFCPSNIYYPKICCRKFHRMKNLECCNTQEKVCDKCVQYCSSCGNICCWQCLSLSSISECVQCLRLGT